MSRQPEDDTPIIRPKLVRLSDVEPEEIAWLWDQRFAIGKLSLIAGDPGLGKSFLTLDIAARVTTGAKWCDGSGAAPQGSVIILNCEDDLADTVRPRLDAAGADASRIIAIQGIQARSRDGEWERAFDLSRDLSSLEAALDAAPDCRLIVIDPISAYCGDTDSHRNAEVRSMLAPLCELAAGRMVAILAVTHLRKSEGAAVYRAMGSIAFTAAARAAFAVVRDPDDHDRRLLLPVKNNLGNDQTGLAYRLTSRYGDGGVPCVVWDADPVTVTADEAMTPDRKHGPKPDDRTEAEDFLREILATGPRPAAEVAEEAREGHSISKRTLDRARQSVGVVAYRIKVPGPWLWRLPDSKDANQHCQVPKHELPGNLGNLANSSTEMANSGPKNCNIAKFPGVGNLATEADLDDINAMLAEAAECEVA